MTSLDASGFSITLLNSTPDFLDAIDDQTSAVGWPRSIFTPTLSNGHAVDTQATKSTSSLSDSTGPKSKQRLPASIYIH